jgi:hypothetical protein
MNSDISGHYADFYEGQGTVGDWQGRGIVWQEKCMGTAWTRHDICELTWHSMAGERYRHGMGTAWAPDGHGMVCVN